MPIRIKLCAASSISSRFWAFYASGTGHSDDHQYTILRASHRSWEIRDHANATVAVATTLALHPTTIFPGEWMICRDNVWAYDAMYFEHDTLVTSPHKPISIVLLGRDYFMRHRTTKVIWYDDPVTGEVVHSGSKAIFSSGPGVRWCSICNRLISANNFVSQHFRKVHKDEPLPGQSIFNKLEQMLEQLTSRRPIIKSRKRRRSAGRR